MKQFKTYLSVKGYTKQYFIFLAESKREVLGEKINPLEERRNGNSFLKYPS